MNRETWMQILQVAVVAPYIYTISEKQNGYFRFGLKLVAAAIVIRNVPPLVAQVQPLVVAAAKLQADAQQLSALKTANAVEGEYTEKAH